MKKEILVAIVFGLSVGLFITYGLYRTRNVVTDEQTNTIGDDNNTDTDADNTGNLVLHSPEDEIIVGTADITIAGDTDPENFVVIFVNEEEHLTTADVTGAFSIGAELEAGSNVILVYTVDEDGKSSSQERVVIFTTQSLSEETSTASDEKTDSNTDSDTATEDTKASDEN
jgi:hypothetical protein